MKFPWLCTSGERCWGVLEQERELWRGKSSKLIKVQVVGKYLSFFVQARARSSIILERRRWRRREIFNFFSHTFNGFANVANTNWYLIFDSEAVFHVFFCFSSNCSQIFPQYSLTLSYRNRWFIELQSPPSFTRQSTASCCVMRQSFASWNMQKRALKCMWMCDDMTARKECGEKYLQEW